MSNIDQTQRFTSSPEAAAAAALKSGTDLNCGNGYDALNLSLARKLVSEADIDTAVTRTLTGRFELGLFDPPARNPFASIPLSTVGSPTHLSLARKVAADSVVLLKNSAEAGDHPTLPLDPTTLKRVAVLGSHANDTLVQLGNYHGHSAGQTVTPLEALTKRLGSATAVKYSAGCAIVGDGAWEFGDAIAAAAAADVAIVFLGSSSKGSVDGVVHLDTVEKESLDRNSLGLPGVQEDLLKALASQTTTPLVLVLLNGGPIDVEWAEASSRVNAILTTWYPGQEGGNAIADVLLGATAPAGRLPVTWYFRNYTTQILSTDMGMRGWPGRTHRFVQVPVLYPFGHGLSYSRFVYSFRGMRTSSVGEVVVELAITNVGSTVSDEVVLLFGHSTDPAQRSGRTHESGQKGSAANSPPRQKLLAFTRLRSVVSGDTRNVKFVLSGRDLQAVGGDGEWRSISPGCWLITAGTPSSGTHTAASAPLCPP